jgi:hypothetical protein
MSTIEQAALESKLVEVEALALATMNEHVPAGLKLGIVHCLLHLDKALEKSCQAVSEEASGNQQQHVVLPTSPVSLSL